MDFWTGGRPFTGTPSGPNWTPVGATINLGDLEPGEPGLAEWDWLIPSTAPRHSCLLAVATCTEDPIAGAGTLDPDLLVLNSKHVTLKNLEVENAVAGTAMSPEEAITAEIHAKSPEDKMADLHIMWGKLPPRSRLFLVFSHGPTHEPVVDLSPAEWKRLGIGVSNRYAHLFPEATLDTCGRAIRLDRTRVLVMTRGEHETTTIPGIRLAYGAPVHIGLNLVLPRGAAGSYEFDLARLAGKRVLGGVTYSIHVEDGARGSGARRGRSKRGAARAASSRAAGR
jgi:hypothetical protein